MDYLYVQKNYRFLWGFSEIHGAFLEIGWKLISEFSFLRRELAYGSMHLGLGYQTFKIADLYIVLINMKLWKMKPFYVICLLTRSYTVSIVTIQKLILLLESFSR